MLPIRTHLSHLFNRSIVQLLIDLRINYAVISSSLVLFGFFWNDLRGATWHYVALFVGIFFANVFGFILNDFYDAQDDVHEPGKKTRNVFCSPNTQRLGRVVLYASLGLSLFFGGLVSPPILVMIVLLNGLALCYSMPSIRLRNRPLGDWIFIFLWKGLIIFTGYFYFSSMTVWTPFMLGTLTMIMLLSLISQIDNQIRDFAVDKLANTNNSVQRLGSLNATTIKNSLTVLFYAFSLVFCYCLQLYVSMLLILLNVSFYYVIPLNKRRYNLQFALNWLGVIFLEHTIQYFYQQQFFFSVSIGVVAGITIWHMKRIFTPP